MMAQKREKIIVGFFFAVLIEVIFIVLFGSVSNSGNAYNFGLSSSIFSDVTFILVCIFILTIISLVIALFAFSSKDTKEHQKTPNTEISVKYFEKSINEHKTKSNILKELREAGYSAAQIQDFLTEFKDSQKKH
jgi:hypothetical protein